jgi:hypothetical protein
LAREGAAFGEKSLNDAITTQEPTRSNLPARIEAPAYHPDFTHFFAPGERVVWAGRSRGLDFGPDQLIVLAAFLAVGVFPLMAWLFAHFGPIRLTALIAFGLVWTYGLLHALWTLTFSTLNQAVLTDRNLYIRSGLVRRRIRRFGLKRNKLTHKILMLRLTGPAARPLLRLRGAGSNYTGPISLRIDKPFDVARLIKATLHLPLPIEDHTH